VVGAAEDDGAAVEAGSEGFGGFLEPGLAAFGGVDVEEADADRELDAAEVGEDDQGVAVHDTQEGDRAGLEDGGGLWGWALGAAVDEQGGQE